MSPAQALVSHLLTGAYVHPQVHCLVASSPGQSLLVKLFSQSKLPQVAVELVSKCGTSQIIFYKSQTLTQPLSSWKAWLLHAARNRKISNPIPTTGRNVHWGGQAEIAHSNTICSSVHTYTLRLDSVPPCFLFLLLYPHTEMCSISDPPLHTVRAVCISLHFVFCFLWVFFLSSWNLSSSILLW